MIRILFVSDPHAAEAVLDKSLRAVHETRASVFIMSGDLCGKDLHAIVDMGYGEYALQETQHSTRMSHRAALAAEQRLAQTGHYCIWCTETDLASMREDAARVAAQIKTRALERVEQWVERIAAEFESKEATALISPGNDDFREVDGILARFEGHGIQSGLKEPVRVGPLEIVTLEYTNPTPWHTEREASEDELRRLIEARVRSLRRTKTAVFNFHCPPYRTKLDLAPQLNENLELVGGIGGEARVHVGSVAVREAINRLQPALGLHGHIHESPGAERIGRTLCLNPGSEYNNGLMQAMVVDFDTDGTLVDYTRIER